VHIIPVTGLTLPLISMGGTSLIFTFMAIGMILSVSRQIENEQQPA
jgi:cell division protein FtsW